MSMLACQYNQPKRPGDLDLLTLKVVSESRLTWATSADFGLPRPLCSRLRPDVRDRQTSDEHHLMPPPIRGGGIIIVSFGKISFPDHRVLCSFAVILRGSFFQTCLLLTSFSVAVFFSRLSDRVTVCSYRYKAIGYNVETFCMRAVR